MAKTPYDNVFRTLLNKSSSPIIPVANKIFLGLRTGVGALSRGAGVSRSARPVAVLKAPIPPLPNRSEMGRIPDGFSELTTTPVVGFAARKTQYKQPCDLPLTSSNFHKTLAEQSRAEQSRAEQSRAEQSRAEQTFLVGGFLGPQGLFLLHGAGEVILRPSRYTLSFFSKNPFPGSVASRTRCELHHSSDVLFSFFRKALTCSFIVGRSIICGAGLLLSSC